MSVAATPVTSSWNGGELSPLMMGRVDTAIYAIGAEILENFVPAIEGPVQKCPGFRRIRAAAASATWLTRFVFNTTQSYVIEGSEGKARFYTNGERIESGPSTPYEVVVPFEAGEWPALSTQQSYDRMYAAHPAHPPGVLTRTSATTFAYAEEELENGPFGDGNSNEAISVLVTGDDLTSGGEVTITASAAIFQAGHEGALFQVEAYDFSDLPAWEVGVDGNVSGTTIRRSDGKAYLAASSGRTGTVQPTHEEGTEWDGSGNKDVNDKGPYGVKWTYLYDQFGIIRIDSVSPFGMEATGTVLRRVPESLQTVASWRWAHAAFSEAEGWPSHVFLWESRLCYIRGFDLFASVVGDYGGGRANFQQYLSSGRLAPDLAFRYRLAIPDAPLWVKVDRVPIIGTASGEYAVNLKNPASGVQEGNLRLDKQSNYGSAQIDPVEAGTSIIYVQRGGTQLREANYNVGPDRYVSPNINRWARHIARPSLVQLGQQQMTEELLFGVRADGQLVLRSYDPEQEVKGFSRRVLGQDGAVVSAVCIPNEDGSRDDIWALCEWGGAKSVQRMADWWQTGADIADAYFVDDGASDNLDTPSATISGLDWLVGVEVAILADGAVVPRQVVPDSGTITLPFAARKRVVGRPYTARLRTLRPETRDPSGQSSTGKRKRLVNLVLRLLETSGIRIKPNVEAPNGRLETLLDRPTSAAMDAPQPLFTGDTDEKSVGGEYGQDGRYEIISDDPRPCFVVAAMPRLEVSAK